MKKVVELVLMVFIAVVAVGCGESGNKNVVGSMEKFVDCLRERGLVLYFDSQCEVCQKQKDIFGVEFEKLNKVNCWFEEEKCVGIERFPTWKLENGEVLVGYLGFGELERLSNCKLIK